MGGSILVSAPVPVPARRSPAENTRRTAYRFTTPRTPSGALGEALEVITRLWSHTEPFDFDGDYVHLTGAFGNPKPLQRPHPPIAIGGGATPTLRVVARYADVWNFQGGDMADGVRRSAILDRLCTEIGRDPAEVVRSTNVPVSYSSPGDTRTGINQALDAGFQHIVLMLPAPYPDQVAHWVTDQLITRTS